MQVYLNAMRVYTCLYMHAYDVVSLSSHCDFHVTLWTTQWYNPILTTTVYLYNQCSIAQSFLFLDDGASLEPSLLLFLAFRLTGLGRKRLLLLVQGLSICLCVNICAWMCMPFCAHALIFVYICVWAYLGTSDVPAYKGMFLGLYASACVFL